ncbi:hypothetical protein [Paenibacillus apiarius]|uniref:Phr family secreted Rap phosphatase inhibitor n=1 Tax=Paenibacillus apiarius TaxID=46240 RepID=A0ABT4DV32_9BACL|nr:hypothetical protein [Paenibacillus apiarius]MBN3522660.1 hypothetical protein [Paenibacillus apiarius]MCY9513488.1 hypothetical protein [Paenibacillus apiarius]MCY9521215.1 hypothetical protein [Paenibacillus apiarius]MCY9553404.1 hypothetical protein [Paenibacillus apiarius]MCY9559562.1 hypothetical protein [Paenibacillus apiarius]
MKKIASIFLIFALYFGYQQVDSPNTDSSPIAVKMGRSDHHLIGGH